MKDKIKKLNADIQFEITLIEEAVGRLNEVKSRLPVGEDDHTTEPALGTYLMNFYNGIENIIKRACKLHYGCFPDGSAWHKELLRLSCDPPQGKERIFSKDIARKLNKYLSFRHRFISGYGFQLEAELMIDLVEECPEVWTQTKGQIEQFLISLDR